MFGCLKSTKQMNTQGIGLGLFICKKIVQEFEGVIFVRSELGIGSRFTFSMKLEKKIAD
jgi:signal transduction histidine kinase